MPAPSNKTRSTGHEESGALDFIDNQQNQQERLAPSQVIELHRNKNRKNAYNLYNSDQVPVKIVQFLNVGLYSHHSESTLSHQ